MKLHRIEQGHIDWIAALVRSGMTRNQRRKRVGGSITKFSPERGITQRHIKMAGVQYV
jgi:hypothetical protein